MVSGSRHEGSGGRLFQKNRPMRKTLPSLIATAGLAVAFASTAAHSATLSAGYTPGSGSQLLTSNGGGGATLFNDSAATGGTDVNGTGTSFYPVLLDGSGDWSVGQTVSITGIAMTLLDSGTDDGTFTFDVREALRAAP